MISEHDSLHVPVTSLFITISLVLSTFLAVFVGSGTTHFTPGLESHFLKHYYPALSGNSDGHTKDRDA